MDIFHAIILGLVEGVTEFLPISSTGHMVVASSLLGIGENSFVKSFEIIIQLGAIAAAIVFYAKRLLVDRELMQKVIFAFIPTATIGYLFYKILKEYLLGNVLIVLVSLFIGGIILIAVEVYLRNTRAALIETDKEISYMDALTIGCVQALAIIPGVSRSGATIVGGLLLGISREKIVEFSFMLAIPTMLAASALDILKNYQIILAGNLTTLSIGFITAFISALVVIRLFIAFISRFSFVWFGVYRIILAMVIYLFFFHPII